MNADGREFFSIVILPTLLAMFVLILSIQYFQGQAKAEYLSQTQGVELPWYQACFLELQINSIQGELK